MSRTANDVGDVDRLEREFCEDLPHLWMVVQAQNGAPLELSQCRGHCFVLSDREWHAIAFGLPILRGHVENRVRPFLSAEAAAPAHLLPQGAPPAQQSGRKALLSAGR